MDTLPHLFLARNYPDLAALKRSVLPRGEILPPCTLFNDCPREAARPDRLSELDLLDAGIPDALIPQALELAARMDLIHGGAYWDMIGLMLEIVEEPHRVAVEGSTRIATMPLDEEVMAFAAQVLALRVARKAVAG